MISIPIILKVGEQHFWNKSQGFHLHQLRDLRYPQIGPVSHQGRPHTPPHQCLPSSQLSLLGLPCSAAASGGHQVGRSTWLRGKDRYGQTDRANQGSWSQNLRFWEQWLLRHSLCPLGFDTLHPRKFLKRERERTHYFTDFKSTDLLICPSKEKMVCASQFLWSQWSWIRSLKHTLINLYTYKLKR